MGVDQHYLPQHYLKGFIDQSLHETTRVWVFLRPKEIVSNGRRTIVNPKWQNKPVTQTAIEPNGYSDQREDKSYDQVIENWLGKLENKTEPVLVKLRAGKSLTPEEEKWFAVFVALMYLRVPTGTDIVKNYIDRRLEVERDIQDSVASGDVDPVGHSIFRQLHPPFDLSPSVNKDVFAVVRELVIREAESLLRKRWLFRRTTPDKPFISSDAPVVINFAKDNKLWRSSITFATAMSMPICAEVYFVALRPDLPYERVMDDNEVLQANRAFAERAQRLIVSSSPTFLGSDVRLNSFYSGVPNSIGLPIGTARGGGRRLKDVQGER